MKDRKLVHQKANTQEEIERLRAALTKIIHHCEVAATHSAIATVAQKALRQDIPR
jgi:hypothetical protein